ncbi:non-specific lipid-transfer protein 3 [Oryza brachyantha]|uniref:non-specific lipid-transfer protein 3 n=1 Tax=Oryza brachyantha TaxID=4533 RepID=UPI0003EAC4A8|nr:non-specific lipid-transfer protein 3 [Oryza brachyantha]
MESKARRSIWLLLVVVVVVAAGLETARGAGECGRVPVDQMALKLAPCAAATQNPRAAVPPSCCAQVRTIGRNPKCLCAVMLSNTARSAGVKPAVAMTIPKRCAIANRPIGYKCGPYTLP